MKSKLILMSSALSIFTAGCSTVGTPRNPASSEDLECEQSFRDSSRKVSDLERVFRVYQDISTSLVVSLLPSLKSQTDQLEANIQNQKRMCWAAERRSIEVKIAKLKGEIDRIYLSDEFSNLKKQMNEIGN